MVALIAHGTVVSVDTTTSSAVVQVARANHHGSGLVGTQVTVDLSKAAISVADANGDGQENLADVAEGDQVLFQGRITLHGALTGALSATRLIDQSHPATGGGASGTQTASTD
jgi:predicted NodU family carbamoyl transferase